jgi:hypothetical protein
VFSVPTGTPSCQIYLKFAVTRVLPNFFLSTYFSLTMTQSRKNIYDTIYRNFYKLVHSLSTLQKVTYLDSEYQTQTNNTKNFNSLSPFPPICLSFWKENMYHSFMLIIKRFFCSSFYTLSFYTILLLKIFESSFNYFYAYVIIYYTKNSKNGTKNQSLSVKTEYQNR